MTRLRPTLAGPLGLLLLLLLPGLAFAQKAKERPGDGNPDDEPDFIVIQSPFQELEDACVEEGDGKACFEAGRKWRSGQGETKPDRAQAVNLLMAGCRFGSVDACEMAADMFLKMEAGLQLLKDGTVSLDMGSAAEYLRATCEKGRLKACGLWGDLLFDPRSLLPAPDAQARDLKADPLMARQAWSDGCNEGNIEGVLPLPAEGGTLDVDLRSCARLATWYGGGFGGRKSPTRQVYYLERACRAPGGGSFCEEAEAAAATAQVEATKEPEALPDKPTSGRDLNAGVNEPEATRFEDPNLGITSREANDRPSRFEFELGVGARVIYPTSVHELTGGVKWRLGFNFWYHLFGVSIEGGVLTNEPFNQQYRTYTRMMNTVSFKVALPIDVALPIPARMYLVIGVGPTIGALQLVQTPFQLTWGVREMVQLTLSSPHDRGPRQWGGIRVEQQQSWWMSGGEEIEHSTQIMLMVGFTAGGWGPSWKKYAQKKPAPYRPKRRLTPDAMDRTGG